MNCISLDMGSHDIHFRDIAEQVCADCAECDLLEDLARASMTVHRESENEVEKAFALEAAKRLTELSKWFAENAP